MSMSSQDPLAFEAPNPPNTTGSTPDPKTTKIKNISALVMKMRLDSDLSILESGAHADFKVVCGGKEWKVHRIFLSRCPHFRPMVSEDSLFKEAQESSITIEGFEPFEINWLLGYIYSLQVDIDQARATSPSNLYLETCVLTWSLGDYFCLPELCLEAMRRLNERCKKLYIASRCVSVVSDEISFLTDLETGIRAAWRPDRITGHPRKPLMTLATSLHAYLGDQPSFISLLDELPEFTADFVKALLGCPGLQGTGFVHIRAMCKRCGSVVFDAARGEGKELAEGAFAIIPNSLNLRGGQRTFFCSQNCYNGSQSHDSKFTEQLLEEV